MKWKLDRINWHSKGNCWRWWRVRRSVYYSGNMATFTWGRITVWFQRREWIHSENAEVSRGDGSASLNPNQTSNEH